MLFSCTGFSTLVGPVTLSSLRIFKGWNLIGSKKNQTKKGTKKNQKEPRSTKRNQTEPKNWEVTKTTRNGTVGLLVWGLRAGRRVSARETSGVQVLPSDTHRPDNPHMWDYHFLHFISSKPLSYLTRQWSAILSKPMISNFITIISFILYRARQWSPMSNG